VAYTWSPQINPSTFACREPLQQKRLSGWLDLQGTGWKLRTQLAVEACTCVAMSERSEDNDLQREDIWTSHLCRWPLPSCVPRHHAMAGIIRCRANARRERGAVRRLTTGRPASDSWLLGCTGLEFSHLRVDGWNLKGAGRSFIVMMLFSSLPACQGSPLASGRYHVPVEWLNVLLMGLNDWMLIITFFLGYWMLLC
jgi:hypothetical protein